MFFGWFDAIFSFIFPILFLLFIGMFFFALISNLRTWNKNNHSPRLTVPATVVAKRTDVSHSSSANAGDMSGAHGYDTIDSVQLQFCWAQLAATAVEKNATILTDEQWIKYSMSQLLQMAQVFVSKNGSNIGCHVAQIFIDIHKK